MSPFGRKLASFLKTPNSLSRNRPNPKSHHRRSPIQLWHPERSNSRTCELRSRRARPERSRMEPAVALAIVVAVACPFACHPVGICCCRCSGRCILQWPLHVILTLNEVEGGTRISEGSEATRVPSTLQSNVISTEAAHSLIVSSAVEKPALSVAERDPCISLLSLPLPLLVLLFVIP
jgi:hypothetical protein